MVCLKNRCRWRRLFKRFRVFVQRGQRIGHELVLGSMLWSPHTQVKRCMLHLVVIVIGVSLQGKRKSQLLLMPATVKQIYGNRKLGKAVPPSWDRNLLTVWVAETTSLGGTRVLWIL